MAYEVRGLDFINDIHQRPEGWLRSDYHRWLLAADNRAHYMEQRTLQELGREQVTVDVQQHREHGRAVAAEVAEQRRQTAEQIKELQARKAEEFHAMKQAASERAEKLKAKATAYAAHAAMCAREARGHNQNASAARVESAVPARRHR